MQKPSREELTKIIEELKEKLEQEPNNASYWHDYGVAYMHLGDWETAAQHLAHSLKFLKGKQAVSSHYHLGTVYAEQGEMDKAIDEWKTVIKLDERNVFAHYSIAKVYAYKELYDAAIMHLKKADRYNTNRSLKLIYQTLAQVYMLKGDYEEAINVWQKVVLIDNEDIRALHQIAMLYLHTNEMEKAIEYCQKEIALGSNDPSVYYNIGLAYLSLNKAEEAINNFEKALAGGLKDVNIRVNLGEAYARQGKVDEAIRAWEQVLAIDPKNIHASYNIGILLYDHGLFERALLAWQKTLSIKQDYLPAIVSSGSANLALQQYQKAYDFMQYAKELAPNNAAIRGNLAEILLYMEKAEEALEETHQAARIQQNNPLVFVISACCYVKLEQWEQAAIALEQAYEIDKNVFNLTYKLIKDHLKESDMKNISQYYEGDKKMLDAINNVLSRADINDERVKEQGTSENGIAELLKRFLRR